MATPQYDALLLKVRDWANNRETSTLPDSVVEDCLRYGADDIYRTLRIPQLETTLEFVVDSTNQDNEMFSEFEVPEDLIEFIYLAQKDDTLAKITRVYNQVNDVRSFMDPFQEQYNKFRYVWKDLTFLVYPKLEVGDRLELHYYRRLAQLDALYSVVPENWDGAYSDGAQPLLESVIADGTILYKSGTGTPTVFLTEQEALDWAVIDGGSVTELMYIGRESWNWLRDANERVTIFAALKHIGSYLDNDKMEQRYAAKMNEIIDQLNREDKFRKAKGGNVQMNVNTGGLI